MKITAIDCFGYELHYAHGEYVMSGNRAATSEVGTLVRVRTDEDIEGWGEMTPLGDLYLPTHWRQVRAALPTLAPRLIGGHPTNISAIHPTMNATLLGRDNAKAAI